MAKLIACGPLSDETEEALHLNYKGGMLKDFLRTNDFAIQLQESNRQLRARIATLEKDNGDLILDNSRYVDDNTKLLNEAEALRDKIAALEVEKEQAVLAEHGGWDLLIELRSMLKETGVDACQRGSSNDKLYKRIDKAIRARSQGEPKKESKP